MLNEITVEGLTLTGEQARVIQATVPDATTNLAQRAFDDVYPRLYREALNEAQALLRKTFESQGNTDGLPNYIDNSAVLEWYFAQLEA